MEAGVAGFRVHWSTESGNKEIDTDEINRFQNQRCLSDKAPTRFHRSIDPGETRMTETPPLETARRRHRVGTIYSAMR